MKKISSYFQRSLNRLADYSLRNRFLERLLKLYYQAAVKSLAFFLRQWPFAQISNVYLRHDEWILGASDIDLVFIIKSQTISRDTIFFKKLWKLYRILRSVFPMLCDFEEIRFIAFEQIDKHPLKQNSEAFLLLVPQKWKCIYSKDTPDPSGPFSLGPALKPGAPLTRFLHFNFYNYMQWVILSGQEISELKFLRLRKSIIKILQHLFYINKYADMDMEDLVNRLSDPAFPAQDTQDPVIGSIFQHLENIPHTPCERQDSVIHAFRESILNIHKTHHARFDLGNGSISALHSSDTTWMGEGLINFIKQGKEKFAHRFQSVVIKPLWFLPMRAFILIDENTDADLFKELVHFSTQFNQRLFNSGIRLFFITDKILTSQFYSLWSPLALEAHILLSRGSFNPDGLLKIKLPPEEWTLWKIRNSVSIFEEYYLHFLLLPFAKGKGNDFCKIYERPEVEMLFQYFYYLKDPAGYFHELKRTRGDFNEMLCIAASKYAHEMGLENWHPNKYESAYPYIKNLIRLIDRIAYEKSMKITD